MSEDSILKFDSKTKRRCPATIFAINRTARVKGRIILLTVSIKTMNLMRAIGVPIGVRWDKKLVHLIFKAIIILVAHKIKAIERLRLIWEDVDIIKGNKDKKFREKITIKIEKIIFLIPIVLFFSLTRLSNSFLNSLLRKEVRVKFNTFLLFNENHEVLAFNFK